jgi:molybdopterin converting factor subunit 1
LKRVKVLYFAAVRDRLGRAEESLELPDAIGTILEFGRHLEDIHPELHGSLVSVRYAVNESFVGLAHELEPGDVIAVIPPVAGG